MKQLSRRGFLAGAAGVLFTRASRAVPGKAAARVVVIGGGFAGATCAKYLRRLAPTLEVSLLEPSAPYVSCPFSNTVVTGARELDALTIGYADLHARHGVQVVSQRADTIDLDRREVRAGELRLPYDRLVVAAGIRLRWHSPQGYDRAAALRMPHAWRAGAQTSLLRRQLAAMDDGGVVIIAIPRAPFRCPPGPYERASLIAHSLSLTKPRSKVLVLDANESFTKQALFEEAWQALYPGLIERVPFSDDGEVVRVEADTLSVHTEFTVHHAAVANIIPAQSAGAIAQDADLADTSGWCPVNPATFESDRVQGVHVIGDAAVAAPMPKSASAANSQAKLCALAVIAALREEPAPPASLHNTCYSLLAPDYAISVNGIYGVTAGTIVPVEGAGGVSPLAADRARRRTEAEYAWGWYRSIVADSFG